MSHFIVQADGQWIDSLRVSDQEFQSLITELDEKLASEADAKAARAPRFTYTRDRFVLLEIIHPGGNVGRFLVRPRELSCTGMSIIHGSFMYTGIQCRVRLRNRKCEVITLNAIVKRCHHLRGNYHEVGIDFAEPIDIADFISAASASSFT